MSEQLELTPSSQAACKTGGATPSECKTPPAKSGEQLKEAGIRRAVSHRREEFQWLLAEAKRLARYNGSVTAEELRASALDEGSSWDIEVGNMLGPMVGEYDFRYLAGAVFADGDTWEEVGRVKATHAAAHGRKITKWRLRR